MNRCVQFLHDTRVITSCGKTLPFFTLNETKCECSSSYFKNLPTTYLKTSRMLLKQKESGTRVKTAFRSKSLHGNPCKALSMCCEVLFLVTGVLSVIDSCIKTRLSDLHVLSLLAAAMSFAMVSFSFSFPLAAV